MRFWPLACASLLAACSALTNLDGLNGSSDAGGDVNSDVAPDQNVADASTDGDASDAKDAFVHESGPGCDAISPTPTICEDFDEPDAKTVSDLGTPNVNPGDQITIDGVDFFSAPRSFVASVPLSSQQGLANITMPLVQSPPATAEAQFEALVVDPGTTASSFSFFQPNAMSVTLVTTPTGGWIQEGPFSSGQMYNNHPPVSIDWSSGWVKLDLKIVQSPPSETFMVNGKVLETQALDSRFVFTGPLQCTIGFTYVPPNAGPITFRVDNLAFWITP